MEPRQGPPGRFEYEWMRDQLYPLFRDALRGGPDGSDPAWQPAVDVLESRELVEIRIDLVGLSEEEVTVERTGDRIVVRADWTEESTQRDRKREETERTKRGFERSFRIPDGLDPASLDSRYAHGLLTITLKKVR